MFTTENLRGLKVCELLMVDNVMTVWRERYVIKEESDIIIYCVFTSNVHCNMRIKNYKVLSRD